MFQVRSMTHEDFAFAIQITDQIGWGLAKEDFKFMIELEPKGSFILLDDSEKIGIATTVSFGKIGWFGNLIVSEKRRKEGAGSLLVKHAIKYLTSKKVETIGLYAYMERIPFYKRLGFQLDSGFTVLKGTAFSSQIKPNLKRAEKQDINKIIDYDSSCFGASRRKLLEPILSDQDNLCYMHIQDGQISGYAVAKVYRGVAELGPLMCQQGRRDIAINLLRTILRRLKGREVSMCVAEKEKPLLNMLKESEFSESFRVARMFLGRPVGGNCIYVAESLERG
jgi:GNAT superfamily N-acetyltransferase